MPDDSERFLPYGRHLVEQDDVEAVVQVLRGDWLTTGPTVAAFERAVAKRVGARHAVACSSGTAALHLAMAGLRLGPGDAVVVPSMTFLADANAVRLAGAEVLLADVDPDTGLLGPEHAGAALARAGELRARAVVPVHLNGQCADVDALAAAFPELVMIEDACHAFGARRRCRGAWTPVGSCQGSALTAFSFHAVKTIAMGEGGIVTTDSEELARRLARLRNHGIERDSDHFENAREAFDRKGKPNPWYHELVELGLNYRASDIHCALGLSQLAKLDRFVERRRGLVAAYDERIGGLAPRVVPVRRVPACEPAWHLYPVLIDFASLGIERSELMGRLREAGIGTQVHYIPVHRQPYYARRYPKLELPGADAYYARVLSLPLFAGMRDADVDRVVSSLGRALGLPSS